MAIERKKVAIVGCGNVGSTLAFHLVTEHICDDLLLIDRNMEKANAEKLDLLHSLGYSGNKINIEAGRYEECADMDIIVLSVAAPYKTGMTRLDMAGNAVAIIRSIVPQIMKSGFQGIFIVITNPVDVVTYYVKKISGLPDERVIGTGTSLDSARLRQYLAQLMDVDARSVEAFCMGEHGDSQFIPWSLASVGGKKFTEILQDNPMRLQGIKLEEVKNYISKVAYDIVNAKGATTYGIAAVTGQIMKAIMQDENKVIPVSAMLHGEYGQDDIYMGVPAVLTSKGVKELVEYHLTDEEKLQFMQSAEQVRKINQMME